MNVQEFEATNFRELMTELAEKNDKLLKDYYAVAQTCDDQKDEIAKLKEDLAAMTAYAEMFERGEIGNPDVANATLITDKLAQLYTKLEMYEKEPKKSYVEQIMELQDEVKALRRRLHWIWAIGVDYDGYKGSAKDLEELIDEMVDFTQMSEEEVTERLASNKQLKQNVDDLAMQVCQLTDKLSDRDLEIARLRKYDEERDIQLHARLSDEAYRKGVADVATKIMHYLYPLWEDATSKNVAIGKTLDWIKATFGV